MRRPLILDTDGGVDDAQALMLLLAHGRVPEAITTVFGNVPLEAATRNVLAVLGHAGAGVPVHAGAAGPLVGAAVHATGIHGADGLGGAPRPDRMAAPAGDDAVGWLVARLRRAAAGERVDVLAIGPLTNLALALRLAPDCAGGIGALTIMGGTLEGRGNVTPAAEFNVFADPEAASLVLRAGLATTVVPWEPCRRTRVPGAEVDALFEDVPDDARGRFDRALAAHARRTIRGFTGRDDFRFVDPFAAAVALDGHVATGRLEASCDVVLSPGIARGMTVVDPSGRLGTARVEIVTQGDTARLMALYGASLRWRG